MLKHEWYHFVILRKVVNGHSSSEHLGWPMTWGGLGQVIREAGLDATGRDPMDALMQLHERNMIILRKTHTNGLWFTTFDYEEYPDKNKFFWGEFGVHVTSAGSAYFNELEAEAFAAIRRAAPTNQIKIGFHA
ncbi:MAG: hypothetical protein JST77_09095 [Acidobacteria bacterium]|nr:hypothetical protein [Acidobacteriota bacterium]